MKIKKILTILIALLAACIFIFFGFKNIDKKNINHNAISKTTSQERATNSTTTKGENTTVNKSTTQNIYVKIINALVVQNTIHVGNIINGASSGDCKLSAIKDNNEIVLSTSKVILDGNNYDCGIFNVPIIKLSSSGQWTIKLTVDSGGDLVSDSEVLDVNL